MEAWMKADKDYSEIGFGEEGKRQMKIAVVDDSIEDAQRIDTYLAQFQSEHNRTFQIKVFHSSFDFLEEYRGEYDIIFLDIEMPGSNGLEVAREIRQRDQAVGIVFITSLAQYAIEGYEVQAIDFMVKPVGYYNFSMKLEKAFRFIDSHREQDILINDKSGIFRISVSDIQYIEKDRDYLLFYTRQGTSKTRGSMKEIKIKLESLPFSECSYGCLVNLNYVRRVGKDSVVLTSDKELPLSRRLKNCLHRIISTLWEVCNMIYNLFESLCIQFPFQLLISEAIFLIDVPKRKHFLPRLVLGLVLQILLGAFWEYALTLMIPQSLFQYVLLYLGYALLTIVPICGSFETGIKELIFILAGGYATEHMTFALSKIVLYLIHAKYQLHGNLLHLLLTRYIIYLFGAAAIYFLIIRKKKKENKLRDSDFRIAVLGFIIMVFAIGFSVYWSYPEEYMGTRIGDVICPAYSFLCCVLVLLMEYYVLRENSMKHEQEMMEQLIQISNTQQKSSKEAIDIINMKCHDLKHQMKALAKMEDDQSRTEYLQEIQDAVSIYDATYHTGCSALDYVLREKTLLFNERKIEFSCMVEGSMISYMTSADVYALMGNALENALERVLKEKEGERVISFQIKHHNDMVLIHLENRCSSQLEFENGLPVTEKKDRTRHGFGVKSMVYIIDKYHGELLMSVQDGKFNLDILFPSQAEE